MSRNTCAIVAEKYPSFSALTPDRREARLVGTNSERIGEQTTFVSTKTEVLCLSLLMVLPSSSNSGSSGSSASSTVIPLVKSGASGERTNGTEATEKKKDGKMKEECDETKGERGERPRKGNGQGISKEMKAQEKKPKSVPRWMDI